MSLRPVLYAIDNRNVPGCGAQSCVKAVMLVGTPAMWFIAVPVLGWAVWRAFVKRDWRYAVVLVGYSRGLPAVVRRHRPADVLLLRRADGAVPGDGDRADPRRHPATSPRQNAERRTLGLLVVCIYVALVITNFAWMYPILTGHADLAVDLEHADLAAQLALTVGAFALDFASWAVAGVIHSPGRKICARQAELSAATATIAACRKS